MSINRAIASVSAIVIAATGDEHNGGCCGGCETSPGAVLPRGVEVSDLVGGVDTLHD